MHLRHACPLKECTILNKLKPVINYNVLTWEQ